MGGALPMAFSAPQHFAATIAVSAHRTKRTGLVLAIVISLQAAACGGAAVPPVAFAAALNPDGRIVSDGWAYSEASISPNGNAVAFFGLSPSGSFSVGIAEGGRPKQLTPPDVAVEAFAWMPDSERVMVSERVGAVDDTRQTLTLALWSTATGQETRVIASRLPYNNALDNDQGIAVAPDGLSAVLAVSPPSASVLPDSLLRVDLTSGRTSVIAPARPGSTWGRPCFIDSEHVIVGGGTLLANPNGEIQTVDVRTGRATLLSPSTDVSIDPTCAFETRQVVYYVQEPAEDRGFWRSSWPGGNRERISQDNSVSHPAVAPDGRAVLVLAIAPNEGFLLLDDHG